MARRIPPPKSGKGKTSRRDYFLSTATRLFADQGFNRTTVRQITNECGTSEAALYNHFRNKDHLYEEVIREKARRHNIRESISPDWSKGSVEDMLGAASHHLLKITKRDPELLRMLLFSSLEGFSFSETLYKEFRQPYIHFIDRDLKARVKSGEIRKVNTFITSRCFVGMVIDCALNAELWNDFEKTSFSPARTVKNNIPIFARGLLNDV